MVNWILFSGVCFREGFVLVWILCFFVGVFILIFFIRLLFKYLLGVNFLIWLYWVLSSGVDCLEGFILNFKLVFFIGVFIMFIFSWFCEVIIDDG